MEGRPVTIRTLDLGADKYPRYLHVPHEENPFLGWRSIRISLELPEIFKVQLRAILRASAHGPVRMMFPMISSLEEIRRVKELLAEAEDDLRSSGQAFDPNMPVGMMMEVPAAVYLAPILAEEVDFFSIGTNDLIQYVLAVDRNNRKVGPLYEPLHPAVIQCVANAVNAAKHAGKRVSICGEMAADPMCTLLLVGLGLDDLSMGPFFIPIIKRLIRAASFETAQSLAEEALAPADRQGDQELRLRGHARSRHDRHRRDVPLKIVLVLVFVFVRSKAALPLHEHDHEHEHDPPIWTIRPALPTRPPAGGRSCTGPARRSRWDDTGGAEPSCTGREGHGIPHCCGRQLR